jgi:prepilin-type N-terminal cleavage/methylation domain-containing protein
MVALHESSRISRHPGGAGGSSKIAFCWPRRAATTLRKPVGAGAKARPGFTLIELLVVVAILALLAAILLPSLSRARAQAKLVVCLSNLHQLGTSIISYAHDQGVIPNGPNVQALAPFLEPNDGTLATNQIWTGPQQPMKQRMALGLLLSRAMNVPPMMYCPGDDSNDPAEELDKILMRKIAPAYSSYLYRQLDEADGHGRIENLGKNGAGRKAITLALDINSLITIDPSFLRTNHKALKVNVLYADASARTFDNRTNRFSLRDQDLADMAGRRDMILQSADAGR